MKFIIKHEIKGRIRISLARKFHTVREADVLEQYLEEDTCEAFCSRYKGL